MFDDIGREIGRLGGSQQVSVAIPPDEHGYDDKECPNPECLARFKINTDDWTSLVSDEVVYCPVCRFEANSQSWFTADQIEYAKRVAFDAFQNQFHQAMQRGVRAANRHAPKGGLISCSFEYKPGRRNYVAPLAASEVLEQRSTCEVCGCRYASIGAAFFCPACGHNSARSTFAGTLATVRAGIDLIPRLGEMVGKDAATDLGRGIAENSLGNTVTGFQRYAEATYQALPEPKAVAPFNAFQRLEDGSNLFRSAAKKGYEDTLSRDELRELGRYFQQRHLLVHQDGHVDELYLERSGDRSYRLGQRLVIKPIAVLRAADLVEKLAKSIGQ